MTAAPPPPALVDAARAPGSAGARILARFRRSPVSVRLGSLVVLVILFATACAPWLTRYDPTAFGAMPLMPPGAAHFMGTDDLGRDVLARVLFGGRITLAVGLFSALISIALGLSIGVVAGYSGGMIDELLMRLTEAFQIVPRLLLAMVVVSMIGGQVLNVILVIGCLSWPMAARIVRAQTLLLRHEDFIAAARLSGASYLRIVIRQILPNVLPALLVSASTQVALAILAETALSFLGLGDPNWPSWGQMLQQSQSLLRVAWWMSVFPGAALAFLILALNVLGDGLGSTMMGKAR